MKRLLAAFLAISMIFVFAGCLAKEDNGRGTKSQAESKQTSNQEDKKDDEVKTLNVWYPSPWPWVKTSAQWDESENCKQIEEACGVKLNYEIPVGSVDELLGPMIASDSLPDSFVIGPYNNPYIQQIINSKMAYSISGMMNQFEPEAKKLIPASQFQFHQSADGELYKYVGFEYTEDAVETLKEIGFAPTKGGNEMYVRDDILKSWGKDDITTLDDFADFLRFTKKNYPELSPISANWGGYFLNSFGLQPGSSGSQSRYYVKDNGTLEVFMKDPKYVECYKWLNGLFREGLISANLLTEQEQQFNEHRVNGNFGAFVGAFYDVDNNVNKVLKENNNNFQYTDVGPIDKTPGSFKFSALRSKGDFAWMVSSKIEDPSVPAKWLAYMLSDEGQEHALGGIKDKDFTVDNNEKYKLSAENTYKLNENLEKYCQSNSVIAKFIPWVNLAKWSYFIEEPMLKGEAKKIYELRYPQDRIIDLWGNGFADLDSAISLSSDVGVAMIKCKEAMENNGIKLVSAASDAEFDEIYNKSLRDLEIMGLASYEKAINEEHQKQLKALGK